MACKRMVHAARTLRYPFLFLQRQAIFQIKRLLASSVRELLLQKKIFIVFLSHSPQYPWILLSPSITVSPGIGKLRFLKGDKIYPDCKGRQLINFIGSWTCASWGESSHDYFLLSKYILLFVLFLNRQLSREISPLLSNQRTEQAGLCFLKVLGK